MNDLIERLQYLAETRMEADLAVASLAKIRELDGKIGALEQRERELMHEIERLRGDVVITRHLAGFKEIKA